MSRKSRNLFDKNKIVQCKYTPIQRVGITLDQYKEYLKLKQVLDNKNKVIELMAEHISKQDNDESICKKQLVQVDCSNIYENRNCNECIIQYFESQV